MASTCLGTTSKITQAIPEEMNDWLSGPLDQAYASELVDAIAVKIGTGR